MKKTKLMLVLVLVILFSMTLVANALPPGCPDCGTPGTYHQVFVTYNYGFTGYTPCIHGHPHQDFKYHLWQYTYNLCDECGFSTPKVYYQNDVALCPGEPIPYLPVIEP